jgi:glycogen phosphorylase
MLSDSRYFLEAFQQRFISLLSKSIDEATPADRYFVLASLVNEEIRNKWVKTNNRYLRDGVRQVYYFSLEFLVGKFLESNLLYLGVLDSVRQSLATLDIDLDELVACEPDAGLGNGGLGRLAACFLDSLAALGLPGHGCGIRYKYGLFKQQIIDGYQVELPDNWLQQTNPWESRKPDKAVVVKLHGQVRVEFDERGHAVFIHENYLPVMAVPYDMPILSSGGDVVNTLRLWSAEVSGESFDFSSFSRGDYTSAIAGKVAVEAISEVLYPDDSNYANRLLRLKQQYFFVSAGLQSIIRRFKKGRHDLHLMPEKIVIQINDTHPALAVPELMRILIDDEGFGWDEAWSLTTRMIAYTNHTLLPEALETWPVDLFRDLLPRIYMIVEEINRRLLLELEICCSYNQQRMERMAIISQGVVRMANLAVVGSFSVNGVAQVHTDLLKNVLLKDFYDQYPDRFNNKTNGITHRRWLIKANPDLAATLSAIIGERWKTSPTELYHLAGFKDDRNFHEQLRQVKRLDKERLAAWIREHNGVKVDPDSIFDAHVKRIHAYKRQLLNALHINYLYNRLIDDASFNPPPRTFIFAGKAAPSYYFAKKVIKYINELALLINSDPRVNERIKVVFLENFNVGLGELIYPASDFSEQISTASKEASGTGNMKFMMNGAITIGTNDGANIEIRQLVGDDNFLLFGLNVGEVLAYHRNGGYNAREVLRQDPRLQQVLDQLCDGTLFPGISREEFLPLARELTDYNDEYFILQDFDSYARIQEKSGQIYLQPEVWGRMAVVNIACSGHFSSDNTIRQYAADIWRLN